MGEWKQAWHLLTTEGCQLQRGHTVCTGLVTSHSTEAASEGHVLCDSTCGRVFKRQNQSVVMTAVTWGQRLQGARTFWSDEHLVCPEYDRGYTGVCIS